MILPFSIMPGWHPRGAIVLSENPFLLPAKSATPSRVDSAPVTPVTARPAETPGAFPARDPDHYIALPPSIESATHRFVRVEPEPDAVAGEPTAGHDTTTEESLTEESLAEETRLVPAPPAPPLPAPPSWSLVLPDGRRVLLDGPVLLGRDPAPIAERPTARLIALADSSKTVSKTHALLEPADGRIRVVDLLSTNGVAITSDTVRIVLAPGGEGAVSLDARVELGEFTVRVAADASEL